MSFLPKNHSRCVYMGSINLVFDIDGVLACNAIGSTKIAAFFLKKGAIITALKTHYVFPGVIELMQLLFQTENIKVSFFSSGDRQRNEIFVKQLLELALGQEGYRKIEKNQ